MILLTGAYRLFFPAAGLLAGIAIPLWLVLYMGAADLVADPLTWHQHEMLWGYLPAALAGFLFTAIPNWTRRPPLAPVPLGALFTLWLLARILMFFAPEALVSQLIAVAFLPTVALLALRELLASDNRRNFVVAVMVMLLAASQAVFLWVEAELGLTMGFALAFVLMAQIGGRVTPAFSRNWLKAHGIAALPPSFNPLDRVSLIITVAAAVTWILFGATQVTGFVAILAALALTVRLARWRGWSVIAEPLLFAQHAAYLWLPVSMVLLALASLTDLSSLAQVRHALGAGAIGTMTVIVMLRALLGHSGRAITATPLDRALLVFLHLGAVLRVVAEWADDPMNFIHAGGTLWALGMILFTIRALPIAFAPRA